MPSIFLDNYTLADTIFLGCADQHWDRITKGSFGHGVVHFLIAAIEAMPIIGQIASLFEMALSHFSENACRMRKLLNRAFECKTVKQLYDQANKDLSWYESKWVIQFVDNPIIPFNGYCDYETRIISIKKSLFDDTALSTAIFELTNAVSAPRFKYVCKLARKKKIGCEEFVRQHEEIEFEGTKLHHVIVKEAVQDLKWSQLVDRYFSCEKMTFDYYWSQIKNGPHAEYYRDAWKKRFNT